MTIRNFNHSSLNFRQEIIDICSPLKKLNISYFSHVKIEKGNFISAFTSNPRFTEHYFVNKYYNSDIHMAKNKFQNFVMWDLIERRGMSEKMHSEAAEFGVRHTFTIIEKEIDCDNYYHFAINRDNRSINQVYLENRDLLKMFIEHVKEKISESSILSSIYGEKYEINKNGKYEMSKEMDLIDEDVKYEFLNKLKVLEKKPDFKKIIKNHHASLSKRELEVLSILANGYTAKKIANYLCISSRTVEHHIENIKSKLGVSNKLELLKWHLELTHLKMENSNFI